MSSPLDYPDSHPGWARLMVGMVETLSTHPPGHECTLCRQVRKEGVPVKAAKVDPPVPLHVLREDLVEIVAILDELNPSSRALLNVRDRLELIARAA